jgi:hypothetical protein
MGGVNSNHWQNPTVAILLDSPFSHPEIASSMFELLSKSFSNMGMGQ